MLLQFYQHVEELDVLTGTFQSRPGIRQSGIKIAFYTALLDAVQGFHFPLSTLGFNNRNCHLSSRMREPITDKDFVLFREELRAAADTFLGGNHSLSVMIEVELESLLQRFVRVSELLGTSAEVAAESGSKIPADV